MPLTPRGFVLRAAPHEGAYSIVAGLLAVLATYVVAKSFGRSPLNEEYAAAFVVAAIPTALLLRASAYRQAADKSTRLAPMTRAMKGALVRGLIGGAFTLVMVITLAFLDATSNDYRRLPMLTIVGTFLILGLNHLGRQLMRNR